MVYALEEMTVCTAMVGILSLKTLAYQEAPEQCVVTD